MPTDHSPAVRVFGVSFSYGSLRAIDDVSFTVSSGEALAVLGPNGAGKSTLVSLLLGLAHPERGTVQIFGRPPGEAVAAGEISAVLQQTVLPELVTGEELMRYVKGLFPFTRTVEAVVDLLEIGAFVRRPVQRLSGGQRRRIQMALALILKSPLLYLDEPTEGLDVEARLGLWETLAEMRQGDPRQTVIFTTHDLTEADRFADRILLLSRGRVVALDTPFGLKEAFAAPRLRFRTSRPGQAVALSERTGLRVVEIGPRSYESQGKDTDAMLRLLAAQEGTEGFEVVRASLDEVFTSLVREERSTFQ